MSQTYLDVEKRTEIVLASGSPRRRQLMSELGLQFTVLTAGVDESPMPGESPVQLAERLSRFKAKAVADVLGQNDGRVLVVAADTVVAQDSEILGKPADAADAVRMLTVLRGRMHQVHSAVCVLDVLSGECKTCTNTTQVTMRDYADEEMREYVAGGDPLDKAGAYAIQHPKFAPVLAMDGCLTGVMGLPLGDLCELLAGFGVRPGCPVVEVCERHAAFGCCQRV